MNSTTAALLHVIGWDDPRPQVKIAENLYACRMDNTKVEQLYFGLCSKQRIDDGEPHIYPSYFLALDDHHWLLDRGPDGTIARLCNLLAMHEASIVPMCRFIASGDNFRSAQYTDLLIDYTPGSEFLNRERCSLNAASLAFIQSAWALDDRARRSRHNYMRYVIASDQFYYAQRAHHLDQASINLGIAIEAIASPPSSTELSHQCAFNVASLLGGDRNSREQHYDLIRDFYAQRSRIVHGSPPSDTIYDLAPKVFAVVANCLKLVLSSEAVLRQICAEPERRKLFRSWLFPA